MKFQPKSESEFSNFKNLEPGEYPFTVLESSVQISKSAKNAGKEMCAVKLSVHGPGFDRHVFDYFADWFSEWKLKHFLETTGQGADYLEGRCDPADNAWRGRTGFVKIEIEPARGNFGERNSVKDYLPDEKQKVDVSETGGKKKMPVDDEIDFTP